MGRVDFSTVVFIGDIIFGRCKYRILKIYYKFFVSFVMIKLMFYFCFIFGEDVLKINRYFFLKMKKLL